MISLFASPHFSFLANMLAFRLGTYRRRSDIICIVAIPSPERRNSANIITAKCTGASLRDNSMAPISAHAIWH